MPAFYLAAVHDGRARWDTATPVITTEPGPQPGQAGTVSMPEPEQPVDTAGLTPKQRQLYTDLRAFIDEQGYPPTLGQLGAQVGLARSTVAYYVATLQAKGWVQRDGQVVRGIRVTGARCGNARGEWGSIPDGPA